jgi:branched-chain amino acid transport system permease protein
MIVTTVWSGLSVGCIYALVAMAYNVGLTTSGVLNFAQAQFVGVALFLMYAFSVQLKLATPLAIILTIVVVTIAAVVQEEITIRPVPPSKRDPLALITTVGASLVISSVVGTLFGQFTLSVPLLGADAPFTLLGGRVAPSDLLPIEVAVVCAIVLEVMSKATLFGLAGQATAEDRDAASLRGINNRRMVISSFALGGVIAAIAGVASVPKTYAAAGVADNYVVYGFVCLALFGFGSHKGALAGGALLGLVGAFVQQYLGAEYSNLSILILLLCVLMIRPGGVFSSEAGVRHISKRPALPKHGDLSDMAG